MANQMLLLHSVVEGMEAEEKAKVRRKGKLGNGVDVLFLSFFLVERERRTAEKDGSRRKKLFYHAFLLNSIHFWA